MVGRARGRSRFRVQAAAQRGWKAYLTTDEDVPAEAIVYCPECDEGYAEWIAPDFSMNGFWTYVGATIVVWLVNWGLYSLLDNVFGERTVLA